MEYQLYNADNVVLTHIIKTRIEVEENQVSDENAVCKFCQAKAEKYCENCQEYFCQTCDDLAHGGDEIETHDDRGRIINTLRTQHTRVAIADARPYRFGKCSNQMSHRNRQNEYYDKKKNQAYCTECAIEIAQNSKDKKSLKLLEDAYKEAREKVRNEDPDLKTRAKSIWTQMELIKEQMKEIKHQAETAEQLIKDTVRKAFKDLNEVVKVKTDILKAARLELGR